MTLKSAGCIFYSVQHHNLICGMKKGKFEGFGGKQHPGETEYQTAMREFVEEISNTYLPKNFDWDSDMPEPQYVFVAQGDYSNFVYTYDDYEKIAIILKRHNVLIPETIKQVLARQQGKEHDFITELPFDMQKLNKIRHMIHDYFYRDICMLELATKNYKKLLVNMERELDTVKFSFSGDAVFSITLKLANADYYKISLLNCSNDESNKEFVCQYAALVLKIQ